MYKVLHNIEKLVFGRGAIAQVPDQLEAWRKEGNGSVVYVIDHYFKDHPLLEKLGIGSEDIVCYEDCDVHEPTTRFRWTGCATGSSIRSVCLRPLLAWAAAASWISPKRSA